jgi:hypothetical protein
MMVWVCPPPVRLTDEQLERTDSERLLGEARHPGAKTIRQLVERE